MPMNSPEVTSVSECCLSIILLEPTIPENIIATHNHEIGLKLSMNEKAIIAPITPPIPAV